MEGLNKMKFLIIPLLVTLGISEVQSVKEECLKVDYKTFLRWGERFGDCSDWTHHHTHNIPYAFNAFGASYADGFKINIRKGRASGALWVYPRTGRKSLGAFEIRGSRVQYDDSGDDSIVSVRVSERRGDMKRISRIMNQAYPCLDNGAYMPVVAFVATYVCVEHEEHRDTFQIVIHTDGIRMFVQLNYQALDDHQSAQFGLRDLYSRTKHTLTLSKIDSGSTLLESTNGIRKGVWVYDVTDGTPVRPASCPKTSDECTVTSFGVIHTFDGFHTLPPKNDIVLFARTLLADNDPCGFKVKAKVSRHGKVNWVSVSIGEYITEEDSHIAKIDLDRRPGQVLVREFKKRAAVVSLPFTWTDGKTSVDVTETETGFILDNIACKYKMEYNPGGPDPDTRITVDQVYQEQMDGLCKDFDGDFWNDVHEVKP